MSNKQYTFSFFVTIILGIGIFAYIIFFQKILYMNVEYPMWLHIKKISEQQSSQNINVLLIGDSRAKAGFIPNVFDTKNLKSYNLSIGGATPIEGYYTLKRYLKHHKAPKYLLLSYTPYHLSESDTYIYRTIKFNFLDFSEYSEVEKLAANLDYRSSLKLKSFIKYLLDPFFYLPEFKHGIVSNRKQLNEEILKKLAKSKGHYYFGQANKAEGKNRETSYSNFQNSALLDLYLNMLIKLAKQYDIPIYWYTMPINENSYNALNTMYANKYNDYILSLSKKYKFTVLNKLYFLSNSCFGDRSHLFRGSRKVTLDIRKRLLVQ